MDGNPQLLTDVKFSTHRKGYDPDEVDNFLERVSAAVAQLQDKLRQATERAEAADAQVAEARRLQAEAEAAAERARTQEPGAEGAVAAAGGDAELKKVLLLAQRAADQAVEEANATATRTVADARAKAVNLLAEAEQERDRMLAKARKKADAAAEERARELHEQVTSLDAVRGDLQADVDALSGYLEGERERLRHQLGELTRMVDDPAALALLARPELSETEVPELPGEAEPEPEPEVVAPVADATTESPLADLQEGPVQAPAAEGSSDDTAQPETAESAPTPEEAVAAALDDLPSEAPVASADYPGPEGIDESSSLTSTPPASSEAIDLTTERLFGEGDEGDSGIDDGPPTELFDTVGEQGSSPLGEPDAAADAAMRAFFERDLDEDADAKSSRFGRRR
ncbi:MAG: DivIVA domain-containing protein [Acidimicrobiales bacterium]